MYTVYKKVSKSDYKVYKKSDYKCIKAKCTKKFTSRTTKCTIRSLHKSTKVYKHMFLELLIQNLIILGQKKYGDIRQMLSRGPYSFYDAWRVFVSSQFQTRYCGHTLSRLAEIRHNKTKQSRFPTTWRESLKGWATWGTQLRLYQLSRAFNTSVSSSGEFIWTAVSRVCEMVLGDKVWTG